MAQGKQYQIKIYNRNDILANTVLDAQVGGFPWSYNGGLGELLLTFARKIDDFGEEFDIGIDFKVELRVVDIETPASGKLIYTGYIQKYRQIASGSNEKIEVNCIGYQSLLDRIILKDSDDNTTITYSSVDPSYMIKDIVEKANSVITTTPTSVDNTGLTVSYTFKNNTVMEALNKVIELSPDGYYWFTDANNILYYRRVNYDDTDHILTFKQDYVDLEIEKTAENLANVVYITGGGDPALYRRETRTSSLNEFGRREVRLSDGRVTNTSTADQMMTTHLDKYDHIITKIRVTVADSNLFNAGDSGVDLELLEPGQVVLLSNLSPDLGTLWDIFQWDIDFWDFNILGTLANPFIITRIMYNTDSAQLELGFFDDIFARQYKQLEDKVNTTDSLTISGAPVDA